MKANFELMADYNRWMNERLYEAVSGLNVTELHQDRGAFFGSIMGSLNHILVADIIWLKRYTKHM
ncbi:DinB family protein [Pseudoalteromonas sp. S2755]|uniref:DinB family protein n=1 Tax=Pseudoalteromonas sp. S2755 TaxID=2066523 RepID=UPI0020166944|nr:DinB family protein [Pseudoalteromonas sp. S2755]